jgi:transcriptional regulator with XRE-family HTH domain
VANNPGIPHDPDEPVGVTLARMRKAKRMTGSRLAAEVGMSQPKISRIERGHGLTDPEDIADIARALGAAESSIQELVERAERSHDRMTDWRPTAVGLAGRQKSVAQWEAAAHVLRDFETGVVAGLLQTSGYARSVLMAMQRLAQPDDQVSESAVLAAVSERVRRQTVLADPAKSFRFLMTEAVLRNQICPPAEMLAQIAHLRDTAARRDNVVIGIVPDGAAVAIPPLHGFNLFDDTMVIIDVYNTGLVSRGRNDAVRYREVFDAFEESAAGDSGPILEKYEERYIEQLRRPSSRPPVTG